ncbi:hypothetical protein DFH07DRAFT_82233 [Mycena maculata]|uniref:Histone H1 n=1 Tax=Mycena maculata TaxID=230809 RepID=A0AAD7IBT4_9AGAR|nr:hypothetical protein DFH07DRAFT_82233 [Mycena maculata]
MPTATKKPSAKAPAGARAKGSASSKTVTHPSWIDMIKECIIAHPEDARGGVSRPTIKKFVETKYKVELNPSTASQLNRAITSGSERGTFVLPKGPSGKVKLTPKVRGEATKENSKPVSKAKLTVAKAAIKPKPAVPAAKAKPKAKATTTTKPAAKKAGAPKKVLAGKTKTAPAKKSTAASKRTPAKKVGCSTSRPKHPNDIFACLGRGREKARNSQETSHEEADHCEEGSSQEGLRRQAESKDSCEGKTQVHHQSQACIQDVC